LRVFAGKPDFMLHGRHNFSFFPVARILPSLSKDRQTECDRYL
jgi:hypothetical protein